MLRVMCIFKAESSERNKKFSKDVDDLKRPQVVQRTHLFIKIRHGGPIFGGLEITWSGSCLDQGASEQPSRWF